METVYAMIKKALYEKIEICADAADKAVLCSPSGVKRELEAIEVCDLEFLYDENKLETVKNNGVRKIFRFFLDEIGVYSLEINGEKNEIEVTEGEVKGYVGVSKKDPRYFALSGGEAFLPMGINLAFPSVYLTPNGFKYKGLWQYERWFDQCSKNGVKLARIWLGHEYFCPDTEEVGVFNIENLTKIDLLLDLAEKYGLKLKLVLEQFRYFDYERKADGESYADDVFRKFNKRLYKDGRRCESVVEWLKEETWQKAWLLKVSELAKRISENPTVFAIELWNEFDCLPRRVRDAWNEKMLCEVKKLFPKHLVTNSLGSLDSARSLEKYKGFGWENSDLKELHRYLDRGAELDICHDSLVELILDGIDIIKDDLKPTVVSESGAVADCHSGPFPYYKDDAEGMLFCDAVYTPLFAGAADCGNIWHWDDRYVDAHGHFKLFKPLSALCEGVNFDSEEFCSKVIEDEDVVLMLLCGKTATLGYLRNKKTNWRNCFCDKIKVAGITNKFVAVEESGAFSTVKIHNPSDDVEFGNGHLTIRELDFGILLKWKR